jgi:hypothetical protein
LSVDVLEKNKQQKTLFFFKTKMCDIPRYKLEDYEDDCFDNEIDGKKGKDLTTLQKEFILQRWKVADIEYLLDEESRKLDRLKKQLVEESSKK